MRSADGLVLDFSTFQGLVLRKEFKAGSHTTNPFSDPSPAATQMCRLRPNDRLCSIYHGRV